MARLFWKAGTLLANALGLSGVVLKRWTECLRNRRQCRIQPTSSGSDPTVSEQSHPTGGKAYSRSVTRSPADSSVAASLVTSSAFDRGGSLKSTVKHTAHGITVSSLPSARPSAKGGRTKHPRAWNDFHGTGKVPVIDAKAATTPKSRNPSGLASEPTESPHKPPGTGVDAGTQASHGSTLSPCAKATPGADETALSPKGNVQQGEVQKHKSARSSRRITRAATNASGFEASTLRSSYQQHLQELDEHRATLYSLKREYGHAKADYERWESTLRCLRRQDQHPLWFWRQQKTRAERSLGKTARKLRQTRISESEIMIKVWTEPQLYGHG